MKRTDVTYLDKLNELRLDIKHPNNIPLAYILVEGDSDIRFFRKFFDLKASKVESIPGGKIKVEDCVQELLGLRSGIIGIRDADFKNLSAGPSSKKGIFYSDFHDLEITLLLEDSVFSSIIHEFTDLEIDHHLNLRDSLLISFKQVSLLKWLNDLNDLRLDFDSTNFQILISCESFILDFELYFNRLVGKSKNARLTDLGTAIDNIQDLANLNPNEFDLANGHDFMKILAHYLRLTYNVSLNEAQIESMFRLKFDANMFSKTKLFQNLAKWSQDNHYKILIN